MIMLSKTDRETVRIEEDEGFETEEQFFFILCRDHLGNDPQLFWPKKGEPSSHLARRLTGDIPSVMYFVSTPNTADCLSIPASKQLMQVVVEWIDLYKKILEARKELESS